MNILNYKTYNLIKGLKPAWLEFDNQVDEGIQYVKDDSESEKIMIDFDQDLPGDVVKLKDPSVPAERRFMYKFPVYAGYKLEEKHPDYANFIEFAKSPSAISDIELKALINHTFPKKLRELNMAVLFATGSSSSMSIRIAEALRDLYYKNAKIVDVLKAYYGADIRDIIDWDEYAKADPQTRKMIDSFLRSGSKDFKGYIKKSGGLQSGARKLLKPGHLIDVGITSAIESEYDNWYDKSKDKYPGWDPVKRWPRFLFVDEFAIAGSTVSRIFKELDSIKWEPRRGTSMSDFLRLGTYGYVLFSHGKDWRSNKS